jgi:hypothetical protein
MYLTKRTTCTVHKLLSLADIICFPRHSYVNFSLTEVETHLEHEAVLISKSLLAEKKRKTVIYGTRSFLSYNINFGEIKAEPKKVNVH